MGVRPLRWLYDCHWAVAEFIGLGVVVSASVSHFVIDADAIKRGSNNRHQKLLLGLACLFKLYDRDFKCILQSNVVDKGK